MPLKQFVDMGRLKVGDLRYGESCDAIHFAGEDTIPFPTKKQMTIPRKDHPTYLMVGGGR
jgi:hypothetical protein